MIELDLEEELEESSSVRLKLSRLFIFATLDSHAGRWRG